MSESDAIVEPSRPDVDGRKDSPAALRESEERLRTVLEGIAEAFYAIDRDGTFLFASRSALELWGKRSDEVLGHAFLEAFPDAAGSDAYEAHVRVMRTGKAERLETISPILDRWIEIDFTPTPQGGLSVAFRDIEAKKQADRQQAFLLRLGDALRPLASGAEMERTAMRVLGEELGADRAFFAVIGDDGESWSIRHDYANGLPTLAGRYQMSEFQRMRLPQWQAGETSRVDDSASDPDLSDADRAAYAVFDSRAAIGVPLVKGGRFAALLSVNQTGLRRWTAAEIALTREAAERTWVEIERARAEAALRESESRYQALFAASPVPFMVLAPDAPDFTITAVNDAYLTATLTTREGLVGHRLFDVFTDDPDRPGERGTDALALSLDRVLTTRRPDAMSRTRYDIAAPNGGFEPHWWLAINAPVLGAAGEVVAIVHQVKRVTDEYRAEEALRLSEERLRRFGEASLDVLWIRDAKTLQWTYLTPAFEKIYGIARDVALAGDNYLSWTSLIVPEDRDQAMAAIERVGTGENATFEYRVRRPSDGAIRWLRNTDFPIVDANGDLVSIGGIGHDITEAKEIQSTLAALERRQRALIEGLPQLVWRAVGAGQWTWASPQWSAYTGQSVDASRDRGWLDAVEPADRRAMEDAWGTAPARGSFVAQCRIRCASDGRYRWFQVRAEPVRDGEGHILEWLGTCTDIDDQVRAREHLAHASEELEARVASRTTELSEALETLHREVLEREDAERRMRQGEKLKSVGQLTAGIAHDFNNMLQTITTSLAVVRARLGQGRVHDATDFLGRADGGVQRAALLTQRLLAFGRQQTLSPVPVVVGDVARDMVELIQRTVGPAVRVDLRLADRNWLVLCDTNQLESALLNLAVNARDAMPQGGWLTIATDEVVVTDEEIVGHEEARAGRHVVLAVSDTGVGMAPDVQARVFEPFFTTKPAGQGTGLGLSQIYGFVQQSGGIVRIESAEGNGTTVRLFLPFHALRPDADAAEPGRLGRTLLLVDDETEAREMTAVLLREIGYRVLEAGDGAAALRIVQSGAPLDLLITDVGLPGMNGRQVAAAVRERHPDLPVIFITGYAGTEPLNGHATLHKPFDVSVLAEVVERTLDRATTLGSPHDA